MATDNTKNGLDEKLARRRHCGDHAPDVAPTFHLEAVRAVVRNAVRVEAAPALGTPGDYSLEGYPLTLADGTQYEIPAYDYFNTSIDYRFDIGDMETLWRFGINNVTDERAPLGDRFFGFFADAHRDYGRSFYLDARFDF